MKPWFVTLLTSLLVGNLFAQQRTLTIVEESDTTIYELIYLSRDSLKDNKLIAYFKTNPQQIAIEKHYFLNKQSGVTRTFFEDGRPYEVIVYQRGKREGDYTRYNSLGELVIKAQYAAGKKSGYFIDKKKKLQGKYSNGLKKGKWEYNVGTPEYYREYYKSGERIEKRQIFPTANLFKRAKPTIKKELKTPLEDSIHIPVNQDTTWLKLRYVSRDSLPHPAMRKAYYVQFPQVVALTKYVYNGYVNGMYKVYYTDGTLYRFENYTAGFLDGAWKEYDQKGILRIKGKYRDGLKVGKWEYNLKTKDYYKEVYRSGVLKE